MSVLIILGLTIVAGAVLGLAILQLADELIVRRLYCAPMIENEFQRGNNALMRASAPGHTAVS